MCRETEAQRRKCTLSTVIKLVTWHSSLLIPNPILSFFFFFKFFFKLINLFTLAVLGLRFCARAFSSCSKRGPLFIAVRGPLTIAASFLRSTGSRCAGSVIVAHGPSCSAACGILPDQGSNPCPPHWQADSQPLSHQGSPQPNYFLTVLFFHV